MTNDDETTPIDPTQPVDPTRPTDRTSAWDRTTPMDRLLDPAPAGQGPMPGAGAEAGPVPGPVPGRGPSGPGETAAGPSAPAAQPTAPPTTPRPRRSARFGTIFWGVLLLVFALAMAVTALPWFSVDPVTLLLAACIAAGVLLVVAGVAAVVARPRR